MQRRHEGDWPWKGNGRWRAARPWTTRGRGGARGPGPGTPPVPPAPAPRPPGPPTSSGPAPDPPPPTSPRRPRPASSGGWSEGEPVYGFGSSISRSRTGREGNKWAYPGRRLAGGATGRDREKGGEEGGGVGEERTRPRRPPTGCVFCFHVGSTAHKAGEGPVQLSREKGLLSFLFFFFFSFFPF